MLKIFKLASTYRLLLFSWILFLLLLSFDSPDWMKIAYPFPSFDKVKHILGAFILAILVCKSYRVNSVSNLILLWIFCSLLIELMQHLLTHGRREFSVGDIGANIVGFGCGLLLNKIILRKLSKIKKTA